MKLLTQVVRCSGNIFWFMQGRPWLLQLFYQYQRGFQAIFQNEMLIVIQIDFNMFYLSTIAEAGLKESATAILFTVATILAA